MNAQTLELIEPEEWCPIPDYVGLYEVSSAGRIRSLPRLVRRECGSYRTKGGIRRPGRSNRSGYLSLVLTDALCVQRTHYVHALVLLAFVGPRPTGFDACHADNNRGNNRLSNLRWDSRSGNHADKRTHGTGTVGEQHPMARLTNDLVVALRKRRNDGASISTLAAEFNVSRMTASRAAAGKSWSHIQ